MRENAAMCSNQKPEQIVRTGVSRVLVFIDIHVVRLS